MGCWGRPSFDLNEPPVEEEDEKGSIPLILPQKSLPTSNLHTSILFESTGPRMVNNNAFTHAPSGSGFQPFVKHKSLQNTKDDCHQKADDLNANEASTSLTATKCEDNKVSLVASSGALDSQTVDREEAELCDMDGNGDALPGDTTNKHDAATAEIVEKQCEAEENERGFVVSKINKDASFTGTSKGEVEDADKEGKVESALGSEGSGRLSCNSKGDDPADGLEEPLAVLKPKDIRAVEASYAARIANNPGKRPKIRRQC